MKKMQFENKKVYFKNILHQTPVSVYWKDRNSVYLGCNQLQADIAGFASPDDMIGKTDYDMLWGHEAEALRATDKRIIETGQPEELIEAVTLTDGTKHLVLTNKAPLYDEQGNIIGIIGTSLDVTARIAAEEHEKETLSQAIKTYEIYLDNILKNVPGAVYWKDINGFYLGCNHSEAKITGLNSPEEIVGKTDYDLPWDNTANILRTTDQKVMRTGTPEEVIETVKLADGSIVTLLTNKAPLHDTEGNVIGIIGTSLDITKRVEAEEREKEALVIATAAEAQRQTEADIKRAIMILAGSMAHDLRTPLLSLNLKNYQLKKACLNFSQAQSAEVQQKLLNLTEGIDGMIKRMHQLINHNLKALRHSTSASLQEEALVECKSYKGIVDAVNSYPYEDNERDFVEIGAIHNFEFLGNPIFFSRIIFNLLNNALYQIHQNNRGRIYISAQTQDKINIIRFKDTAGGAPLEVINHIFDGYKTTKECGTGVGLAFCKIAMESFGGHIQCLTPDKGSIEFVLEFPKIDDNRLCH